MSARWLCIGAACASLVGPAARAQSPPVEAGAVDSGAVDPCTVPVPATVLTADIDRAESSYAQLQGEGFVGMLEDAALDLQCLDVVVPPGLAGRFHRLLALRLYGEGRSSDARSAFVAARAASPGLDLPTSLVPAGHELHDLFDAAPVSSDASPIPAPLDGFVAVDGLPASTRPADAPAVVQVVDGAGRVLVTRYLLAEEPLPVYASAPPAPDEPPPALSPPRGPRIAKWPLLAGAIVSAAGGVTLYALAARSEAEFKGPLPDAFGREDLRKLQLRTNLLAAGSIAAGAVCAGATFGFVVTVAR